MVWPTDRSLNSWRRRCSRDGRRQPSTKYSSAASLLPFRSAWRASRQLTTPLLGAFRSSSPGTRLSAGSEILGKNEVSGSTPDVGSRQHLQARAPPVGANSLAERRATGLKDTNNVMPLGCFRCAPDRPAPWRGDARPSPNPTGGLPRSPRRHAARPAAVRLRRSGQSGHLVATHAGRREQVAGHARHLAEAGPAVRADSGGPGHAARHPGDPAGALRGLRAGPTPSPLGVDVQHALPQPAALLWLGGRGGRDRRLADATDEAPEVRGARAGRPGGCRPAAPARCFLLSP